MHPIQEALHRSRREFLTGTSSGIGLAALASMLAQQGAIASPVGHLPTDRDDDPLAPRQPPLPAKARACICIYLEGGPSQIDLFDPKPELNRLDGQPLPESFTKNVRFAFIQKESATVMGCPRVFSRWGECGMELSDYLPHLGGCADDLALIRSMHTDQFNHHPGQLLMNTGSAAFGRPSVGSWLTYGLGSEADDLPGYVVLTTGRGTSGGASNWGGGFLPSTYSGVLFRDSGDPVLNLGNPAGLSPRVQRETIDAIGSLNARRFDAVRDEEIQSRIASYELAFRMQSSAPELIDLSGETPETLDLYGVGREDPEGGGRGGGPGVYDRFATNCLLARRMVERGVRFVNIYHASWDHHSNIDSELEFNCGMADRPVAALITDLKRRGLLEDTLVLWCSEFGRTPLGENRPGFKAVTGRDHHPFAFSLFLAGGGVRGGQVIGKTDEIGWNVVEDPVHVHDYHATILRLFGFDHTELTYRYQGRDFRLTDVAGRVVDRLIA
ncbi:DUF1501 domain-containing protein [Tautonia plasticadhaerens]|uniref:Sulfatase n=1 Tax=Tautonia plasticadhaerens TaxID=2527974 RepID=A0A518H7E1_9BACT|nr:DUF1501 domain-containing protein [Tautonia plasticadhaerens]QDV36789.1 hypothetical protein ElP_47180 [Tautonia plasticadhaerens]